MFKISTSTYTPPGNGIGSYISHSSERRDVLGHPEVSSFTTRTVTSRNEACECHLDASGKFESHPIDLETLAKMDFAAQTFFLEPPIDILHVEAGAVIVMDHPAVKCRKIDASKVSDDMPYQDYFRKRHELARDVSIYAASSTLATYIEIEQAEASEKEEPFDIKKYFNLENREFLGTPTHISKVVEVLIVIRGSKTDDSQKPPREVRRKINVSEKEMGNKSFDLNNIKMRHSECAEVSVLIPLKETNEQDSNAVSASSALQPEKQIPVAPPTTTVHVKYDAGYGNTLFIRGEGPGMSWEQGIELKNTGADSWCFEIASDEFKNFAFKIVKNNQSFEEGSNHTIECGKEVVITPVFK